MKKKNYTIIITAVALCLVFTTSDYYLTYKIKHLRNSINLISLELENLSKKNEQDFINKHNEFQDILNEYEKLKMMTLETKLLVETNQKPEVTAVVKKWRPYTAHIVCSWGNPPDRYGSGSGMITKLAANKNAGILTNRHVLINEKEKPAECLVTFPESNKVYQIEDPGIKLFNKKLDAAILEFENTDYYLQNLAESADKAARCSDYADLGNQVIAIGYPGIGVRGDVTVTEGILSGFEDDFYVSSVKIDKGNSGGVAVLVKDNCYLGMPTLSITGEVESLARILKNSALLKNNP